MRNWIYHRLVWDRSTFALLFFFSARGKRLWVPSNFTSERRQQQQRSLNGHRMTINQVPTSIDWFRVKWDNVPRHIWIIKHFLDLMCSSIKSQKLSQHNFFYRLKEQCVCISSHSLSFAGGGKVNSHHLDARAINHNRKNEIKLALSEEIGQLVGHYEFHLIDPRSLDERAKIFSLLLSSLFFFATHYYFFAAFYILFSRSHREDWTLLFIVWWMWFFFLFLSFFLFLFSHPPQLSSSVNWSLLNFVCFLSINSYMKASKQEIIPAEFQISNNGDFQAQANASHTLACAASPVLHPTIMNDLLVYFLCLSLSLAWLWIFFFSWIHSYLSCACFLTYFKLHSRNLFFRLTRPVVATSLRFGAATVALRNEKLTHIFFLLLAQSVEVKIESRRLV